MKLQVFIAIGFLAIAAAGCVQQTNEKTVVFTVDVSGMKNISEIGLRGEKPLSWSNSLKMEAVKRDSLYRATVTFKTGFKFVQAKFTLNNEYELANSDNRRIVFSEADTTYYSAKFDRRD